jgi:PEP-CTERM motif
MLRTMTGKLAMTAIVALTASRGYATVATQLTVDNSASTIEYQQTYDDPCVFGGSDCKNLSPFPTETNINVGGSVSIVDNGTQLGGASDGMPTLFNVSAGDIRGLAGGTFGSVFVIGVDLNVANKAPIDILQLEVWDTTANTELAFLQPGTELNIFRNGTGFTDALLSSVNLNLYSNIADTNNIQFRLQYSGATDGPESFFLISTSVPPPTVPEPITSGLVGTGLVGLFFLRRRAARKA